MEKQDYTKVKNEAAMLLEIATSLELTKSLAKEGLLDKKMVDQYEARQLKQIKNSIAVVFAQLELEKVKSRMDAVFIMGEAKTGDVTQEIVVDVNDMDYRLETIGDSQLIYVKENGIQQQIGIIDKEGRNYSAHLIGFGDIPNGNVPYFSTNNQAEEAIMNKYRALKLATKDNKETSSGRGTL